MYLVIIGQNRYVDNEERTDYDEMFLPKKIVSFPSLSDALGYVRQETNRLVENPSLDYKDYLLGERKFFFYVGDKDDTEQWEFAIIEMEGGRPVIV